MTHKERTSQGVLQGNTHSNIPKTLQHTPIPALPLKQMGGAMDGAQHRIDVITHNGRQYLRKLTQLVADVRAAVRDLLPECEDNADEGLSAMPRQHSLFVAWVTGPVTTTAPDSACNNLHLGNEYKLAFVSETFKASMHAGIVKRSRLRTCMFRLKIFIASYNSL